MKLKLPHLKMKWTLWGLGSVLVAVGALAWFVLATEAGARLALGIVASRLPIHIAYGDVKGTLLGSLELSDLRVELDAISMSIEHLAVDWQPAELLHKRVHIDSLRLSGVHAVLIEQPPGPETEPDSLVDEPASAGESEGLDLPVELVVDALRLRDGSFAVAGLGDSYDINLDAAGTIDSFEVRGQLAVRTPGIEEVRVDLSGTGTLGGFELSALRADVLGGELRATGSVTWAPRVEWRLTLAGDELSPAELTPNPADWPGQLSIRARTEGSWEDSLVARVDVDTLAGVLRDIALAGRISGVIQGSQYSISELDLDWGPLRLRVEGEVGQRLDLDFELRAPDLSVVLPNSSGSVSAIGHIGGSPSAPRVKANLQANAVRVGEARLDSAYADVDVDWGARRNNRAVLQVVGLHISNQLIDSLLLDAHGSREEHVLTLQVASQEAGIELRAAGAVTGESWVGEISRLDIETRAAGNWQLEDKAPLTASRTEATLSSFCLVSTDGEFCVEGSWKSGDRLQIQATIQEVPLYLASQLLPEGWVLAGDVNGAIDASAAAGETLVVEAELRSGHGTVEFRVGGATQSVRFENGRVVLMADADSVTGSVSIQLAGADDARPGMLTGKIHLPAISGIFREALVDDWRLAVSIDRLPLSLLSFYLPDGSSVSGSLSGGIDASAAADGALSFEAELRPGPGTIQYTVGKEVRTLHYEQGSIHLRAGAEGVMGDAALSWGRPDGTPFAVLSGSFELPEYRKLTQSLEAQPLSARVQGGWDLAAIEAFSDDFTESAGRLELDMSARGTVAEPELTGTVRLSGQTDIPRLGLNLREIELTASADAQGELTISGRALSGDGYVVIDGHSPPLPSRESPTRLAVRGDRFLAAETEEIHLEVSPDIEVLFTGTNIEVSGDITIPSATFEVLEIPASAVPVSPDVVFVGQEEDGGAKHVPVSANIRFVLGDEVFFKGFGFSSRLMGAITVSETPGAPARGSGELVFREGVYRGYGQNLTIDPGRLVFAGPIDNPGLDVRAYRTATDGKKAGLLILGTLKEPDVQVWSDPAMSQSEALAYMLFGRPMEQGSQADQASAASAAAALGGSMLAMSMASQIGLDDARIETGTKREDAAFVAGKYLSPQLYVAYGVGLFEPVNTLRIRYLLTSKITLQAVTGSKESTDILYRIER